MKLYTEEEIKRLLKEQIIFDDDDFDKLTPIELPSDEEIENMAIEYFNYAEGIEYEKGFYKIGAKMVINKIQGGSNEQQ